ncbi:MAG: RNA methyltransferase [Rhodospirillales bacterium]|nr:RNA methyltransferase [Alphaproteobacteria bacterium]MCB9986211.1 RNA methyltransferase [Rhodospirillales bacterium]USO07232.1 MAG: RNA methyltransferase [Rhodospirillales bacterium]
MNFVNTRAITSPANEEIKAIRALERRKDRKETGLFVAEGLRHVLEGIENGWDLQRLVFHTKVASKNEVVRATRVCAGNGGLCLEVNDAVLEKLSHKDNPQQVIGVFKQRLSALAGMPAKTCVVALEQVRDPGNLGTILRTVDGVGADGVILIDQCCDPFSVEAVRASMGSLFAVPVAIATRDEFMAFARGWKGTVVGTHLSDRTVDYRKADYKPPVLLVMGNEQAGLSPELSAALPVLAKLPMKGRADSLNLAIATGVMLYKILEG